jgi:hypothetical protein
MNEGSEKKTQRTADKRSLTHAQAWRRAALGTAVLGAAGLLAGCGGAGASSRTVTTGARAQAGNDADYGYEFSPDSTKNAAASPTSDLSLPHVDNDRIRPETVQALVRARYSSVVSCYQAGLAKDPSLAGRVSVKSVIAASGAVEQVADAGSTLADKQVVACVVGELGKVTYPAGGGVLTVVYPIDLAP